MTYRSILTYFDADDASPARLSSAIAVARQFEAHLSVMALGYEPNIPPYSHGEAAGMVLAELTEAAQTEAETHAGAARETLGANDILSDVAPVVTRPGVVAATIGDMAQYADITVLSRPYREGAGRSTNDAFEGALFDGDGTVLICPDGMEEMDLGHVVIAWNGSREALRATRQALPILKRADAVEILMIDPPRQASAPGERLATMLARHDVTVEIAALPGTIHPISAQLRRRVAEQGAGLLVMGAYGHSRFREYMIGGATRDLVAETEVPVLMAH